jgi:hypothetical protein
MKDHSYVLSVAKHLLYSTITSGMEGSIVARRSLSAKVSFDRNQVNTGDVSHRGPRLFERTAASTVEDEINFPLRICFGPRLDVG